MDYLNTNRCVFTHHPLYSNEYEDINKDEILTISFPWRKKNGKREIFYAPVCRWCYRRICKKFAYVEGENWWDAVNYIMENCVCYKKET